MWNYGQGQALGRGRGRGFPPPPFGRGFPPPPPYAPPVAMPAGAQMMGHHANRDGERVNGSRVPQFRDLPEAATLDARAHWVDHVMTELAAVGSGIRVCFQLHQVAMPIPESTAQRLSIGKAGPTGHGK